MADPDNIKVSPVETLCGHTMRRVGAAVEQERSVFSLEPERRRCALGMWNGSAGAEDREFHSGKARLKK